MSAEVENNKEGDDTTTKEQPRKGWKQKFQENWQIALKILELLICAICMGFVYEPATVIGMGKEHLLHHTGVMYTAFTGYMLINVILLISRLIKDRLPYKTVSLFGICGSVMFGVTAVLLIIDRTKLAENHSFHPHTYRLNMIMITIVCSLANAVVFGLDAVLTYWKKKDF